MKIPLIFLVFASGICPVLYWIVQSKGGRMPPGPLGLPIFGYLPFISSEPHKDFQTLANYYGPIFSIRLRTRYAIITDDIQVMMNILSQKRETERKKNHSKPTRNYVRQTFKDQSILFWRMRFCDIMMSPNSERSSLKYSHLKIRRRIKRLKKKLQKTLDVKGPNENEPELHIILEISQFLKNLRFGFQLPVPPSNLDDFIKKRMNHLEVDWLLYKVIDMYCSNFYFLRVSSPIKRRRNLLNVARSLFQMNCKLNCILLEWLVLTVASFPTIQQKLQVEIENTVGFDRYPVADDLTEMPYVRSVVLEFFRWKTFFPLICLWIPKKDLLLDGYFIPKYSLLIANIWSIHQNPRYWGGDVKLFKPERFLSQDGKRIIGEKEFISLLTSDCEGKEHFA